MIPVRGLRSKFVVVLLCGVVLPLGLVGFWLTRTAERSGKELLRTRLAGTLARVVEETGLHWVALRARLLDVADRPREEGLPPGVRTLRIVDAAGVPRLSRTAGSRTEAMEEVLPVELPLYSDEGARLGTLEAEASLDALLPAGAGWMAVGGSVLGVFDGRDGTALLPLDVDRDLFRRGEFVRAGEPWVTVRQELADPPMELVLAAPLGPFIEPFRRAARRGTVALALVALAAFGLAAALSGRMTRSLGHLAEATQAVAAGDLDRSVTVTGDDEIARVARAFNRMTADLKRTLRRSSQRESLAAVGEFATTLAHEIRNPLSGVRLDLQRLQRGTEDAGARKLVARALRSVDRLERTVTGALQVARSGRVERRPVDLSRPLEGAVRSAAPEARSRGGVSIALDAPKAAWVDGDVDALEQVFLNLLLNAVQAAGDGGRVGVEVEVRDDEVAVGVWDTGPGIGPALRERVFEPFYSTRTDGTGLGLAVARRIVEAHGGRIAVGDRKGGGAVLTVRLPVTNRSVPS